MPTAPDIDIEQYRRWFESAPGRHLVLAPDAAFTIVGASDAYLQATMVPRAEAVGRALFDVFPDNPDSPDTDGAANLRRSLERVRKSGSPDSMAVQRYDIRRPTAEGGGFETRYWSVVNTPVLATDGTVEYVIHSVEDVTQYVSATADRQRDVAAMQSERAAMEMAVLWRSDELAKTNKELQQVNAALIALADQAQLEARRKDEFLAMLAHELRTPLASLSLALGLLDTADDGADQRSLMALCRRQLTNLTRLVDDLIDLSRVTRGTIELKREPLDFGDVVRHALQTVQEQFESREQMLEILLPDEPLPMLADATRLEQVITNLLTNAAKFTPPKGGITIVTERDGDDVVLDVTDTGRGLTADQLQIIFDMFVQANSAIDRQFGGLGIGLTLVRSLVMLHGGSVRAGSAGLDRGSTFTVRLPLAARHTGDAERDGASNQMPDGESDERVRARRRVLVIEDNADIRQGLEALLSAAGHDVQTAASGASGVAKARAFEPAVAVVDIGLPEMDGFEVARRLRAEPATNSIYLVALSGYSGSEIDRRATDAGFDVRLVKPVTVDALCAVIARARHDT
jgi:two-component system, sensor histidine kinase